MGTVRIKQVGDAVFRIIDLDNYSFRAAFDVKPVRYYKPLPTGSRALDMATGSGGLLRSAVTSVASENLQPWWRLLLGIIGETQRRGGRIAVVDAGEELTGRAFRGALTDYRDVLLVRTDEVEIALETSVRLLESSDLDLLIVTTSGEVGRLWRDQLGGAVRKRIPRALAVLMRKLKDAADESHTAVVMDAGLADPAPWRPDVNFFLNAPEEVSRRARLPTEIDVRGAVKGRANLSLFPNGLVEPMQDLIDSGVQSPFINQRGTTYRVGDFAPVRGRNELQATLRNDTDQQVRLKGWLDQHLADMRDAAAMRVVDDVAFGVPSTAGDDVEPRRVVTGGGGPEPGRFVNTWFEGDEPVLPLVVGRKALFNLNIGANRSGSETTPRFAHEPTFAGHERIPLRVSLYGVDFDIDPSTKTVMLPPPPDESEPVSFLLTPRRPGDLVLRVVISTGRELEVLQELEVDITATDALVSARRDG